MLLLLELDALFQYLKHLPVAVRQNAEHAVAGHCAEEDARLVHDRKAVEQSFQ